MSFVPRKRFRWKSGDNRFRHGECTMERWEAQGLGTRRDRKQNTKRKCVVTGSGLARGRSFDSRRFRCQISFSLTFGPTEVQRLVHWPTLTNGINSIRPHISTERTQNSSLDCAPPLTDFPQEISRERGISFPGERYRNEMRYVRRNETVIENRVRRNRHWERVGIFSVVPFW